MTHSEKWLWQHLPKSAMVCELSNGSGANCHVLHVGLRDERFLMSLLLLPFSYLPGSVTIPANPVLVFIEHVYT